MFENEVLVQKAVLVCADTGEFDAESSLEELSELARTAGAQVLGKVIQRRESFDTATCIGAGRLLETKELAQAHGANLLIFDHELSATQLRNIEESTGIPVIDRTMLILDIFASRARTSEGKLQVELAQQKYLLPRLMGLGQQMSRLGGGIGTRGPGETKLESDRRHIRRRIQSLESELVEVKKRRELLRERRKKDGVITVAIVGYTNVGKSTLLNALTDAGVLAEDMLFATLDPTGRALTLPDGRSVMLVDTVGLLRRLPHHLVEAFHSTLAEAANAQLILNVCDAASDEAPDQIRTTNEVLESLGAGAVPVLTVLNKCDALPHFPDHVGRQEICISAKTGFGLDTLLTGIAAALTPTHMRMKLCIPFDKGGLYSFLKDDSTVFSEKYTEHGIVVDAMVDIRRKKEVTPYLI